MQSFQARHGATASSQGISPVRAPIVKPAAKMPEAKSTLADDPSQMVALAQRLQPIIEGAAQRLGATPEQAQQIAADGGMDVNGLPVTFIPFPDEVVSGTGLLLLLDTGRKVEADGGAGMSQVLFTAAGLLPAFNAGVSASLEGHWTLHCLVNVQDLSDERLAQHLQAIRSLADVVWASSAA